MVPWWKRLFYGLISWVVATCVAGLFASIWVFTTFPAKRSISVSDVFQFWVLFLITAFAVSIFGWLLGIPYVLLVRSGRGTRFWIFLALGSGIGPVIVFSPLLYSLLAHSSLPSEHADYSTVAISAAVSSLAALIYLLLLRRVQPSRKSI